MHAYVCVAFALPHRCMSHVCVCLLSADATGIDMWMPPEESASALSRVMMTSRPELTTVGVAMLLAEAQAESSATKQKQKQQRLQAVHYSSPTADFIVLEGNATIAKSMAAQSAATAKSMLCRVKSQPAIHASYKAASARLDILIHVLTTHTASTT